MSQNVGNLLVLVNSSKSVCVVKMIMCAHWSCVNINRKDFHALIILINGNEMNEKYGCIAQF